MQLILLAATTVGNYALFGGGRAGSTYFNAVDAYDNTLTKYILHNNSIKPSQRMLSSLAVGNYALFGGGRDGSAYFSSRCLHSIKIKGGIKYEVQNMGQKGTNLYSSG